MSKFLVLLATVRGDSLISTVVYLGLLLFKLASLSGYVCFCFVVFSKRACMSLGLVTPWNIC